MDTGLVDGAGPVVVMTVFIKGHPLVKEVLYHIVIAGQSGPVEKCVALFVNSLDKICVFFFHNLPHLLEVAM